MNQIISFPLTFAEGTKVVIPSLKFRVWDPDHESLIISPLKSGCHGFAVKINGVDYFCLTCFDLSVAADSCGSVYNLKHPEDWLNDETPRPLATYFLSLNTDCPMYRDFRRVLKERSLVDFVEDGVRWYENVVRLLTKEDWMEIICNMTAESIIAEEEYRRESL